MKRFTSRSLALAAFTLVGLTGSTLLTGCFEKDGRGSCGGPKDSTCNTAATVVDLSKTTGCGLALHLADSTYLVPTGANWTNYHAKAGDKVLVGFSAIRNAAATCPAGPVVELGCISVNTKATTGSN